MCANKLNGMDEYLERQEKLLKLRKEVTEN